MTAVPTKPIPAPISNVMKKDPVRSSTRPVTRGESVAPMNPALLKIVVTEATWNSRHQHRRRRPHPGKRGRPKEKGEETQRERRREAIGEARRPGKDRETEGANDDRDLSTGDGGDTAALSQIRNEASAHRARDAAARSR